MPFQDPLMLHRTATQAKSLPVDLGAEHHLSKWSSILCSAAKKRIQRGGNVVDLGAGSQAVITKYLIKSGIQANWLAVEPHYSVEAPPNVAIIRGDLRALPTNSVDVILFNPPVLPKKYLNSFLPHYYLFLGGIDGTEAIDEAIVESQRCLQC